MEMTMLNNYNSVDRYFILKDEIAALTKELDALKAEFVASGMETIEGSIATVTVKLAERTTFDGAEAKKLLTDKQIAKCSKTSLITSVTIKANAKVIKSMVEA